MLAVPVRDEAREMPCRGFIAACVGQREAAFRIGDPVAVSIISDELQGEAGAGMGHATDMHTAKIQAIRPPRLSG